MTAIILIGFMGSGKTQISIKLASILSKKVYDADSYFEEQENETITNYFTEFGEGQFRKKETEILRELVLLDGIIATGGGVIKNPINRLLLSEQPFVCWLKISFQQSIKRIHADEKNSRPLVLANNSEQLENLFNERQKLYEESANFIVNTDDLTEEEVVEKIMIEYQRRSIK